MKADVPHSELSPLSRLNCCPYVLPEIHIVDFIQQGSSFLAVGRSHILQNYILKRLGLDLI